MTSVSRPHSRGTGAEPEPEPATVDDAVERPSGAKGAGAGVRPASSSAADRSALVEQRDFLLASLDDLDRELDAGDIDERDYRALRDDYTARAAAVVRALERHDAGPDDDRPRGASRVRTIAVSAVVVVFAVAAGLVIANNFGQRSAGDSITSAAPTSNREKVSQAQQLEASGDPDALAQAAELYDQVLESDPENVDALTYKGWLLVRAGIPDGMDLLDQAIALRPGFAPPHVFKAVALRNQGDPEGALAELDLVDPTQLSAFAGLVTNLRQELEAQVASGDTSGGAGAASTTTTAP